MVNEFGDGETLCPDAFRAVMTPLFVMGKAEVTATEVTVSPNRLAGTLLSESLRIAGGQVR